MFDIYVFKGGTGKKHYLYFTGYADMPVYSWADRELEPRTDVSRWGASTLRGIMARYPNEEVEKVGTYNTLDESIAIVKTLNLLDI